MTVEQMLQRYTQREQSAAAPPDATGDGIDDLGGYGLLRGIRDRAFALELRKKDGTVLAVPYALIEQYLFAPDAGITLRVGGRDVFIRGQRLNETPDRDAIAPAISLYTAIVRQRVAWVAERSGRSPDAVGTGVRIESVQW